jgi:hypothetical protein
MPFQTIEQQPNYDPNGNRVENHELAKELRELYELPPISIEQAIISAADIITNLNGFLKKYATTTDYGETHLDAIKYSRENIS